MNRTRIRTSWVVETGNRLITTKSGCRYGLWIKNLVCTPGLRMSEPGCLRRSRSDCDSSLLQRGVLADNGADVTTEYGTEPVAIESPAARHEDSNVDFAQDQFG